MEDYQYKAAKKEVNVEFERSLQRKKDIRSALESAFGNPNPPGANLGSWTLRKRSS